MGKLLSVLEKYKLIEKETENMSSSENAAQNLSTASSNQSEQETVGSDSPLDEEYVFETADEHFETASVNTQEASKKYTKEMSLNEIYSFGGLNGYPVTDTVFVLENLINALPAELPEFVKKTTLNNILTASSMNLQKLLSDGTARYSHLQEYADAYSAKNANDISALKQEIEKLSAIISEYHQQIKNKEQMVQKQLTLIKGEEERLQNILDFFEK